MDTTHRRAGPSRRRGLLRLVSLLAQVVSLSVSTADGASPRYPVTRLALDEDGRFERMPPDLDEPPEITLGVRIPGARWAQPSEATTEAPSGPPPIEEAWQVDAWRVEQGLPENDVRALCQTSDGYLWAGTPTGLARFDGNRFVVFDERNTPVLSEVDDDIRVLRPDPEGGLWVGTRIGIARRHRGRWEKIALIDPSEGGRIRDVWVGSQSGRIWVATDKGVGWVVDGKISREGLPADMAEDRHGLLGILETRDGCVWTGGPAGVLRWHPDEEVAATRVWVANPGTSVLGCFAEGQDGAVWAGGPGCVRRFGEAGIEEFCDESGDFAAASVRGHQLGLDSEGRPWAIVGPHARVCRLREGRMVPARTRGGETIDMVGSLACDNEGNVWCGTTDRGLLRLTHPKIETLTMNRPVRSAGAVSVAEGPEGEIWMGSQSSVVVWWKQGAHLVELRTPATWGSKTYAIGVEPDSRKVWTSFAARGVSELRSSVSEFAGEPNVRAPFWLADGGAVRAVVWSNPETVWLGVTNGLFRLRTSGERTHFPARPTEEGFDVRTLCRGRNRRLWIGLRHGGLACLRDAVRASDDSPMERWTETEGLPGRSVWALHEDSAGTVWIGTERGCARLSEGRLVALPVEGPLRGQPIHGIVEDHHGRLWFGHPRGLSRAERSELNAVAEGRSGSARWWSLDESDGMPNGNVPGEYQSVGCRTRDGRLYFPTSQGIAVVDPDKGGLELPSPYVMVERVELDGEKLDSDLGSSSVVAGMPGPETSRSTVASGLPHHRIGPGRARDLRIRYTAASLTVPERLRFEHRLLGLDAVWRAGGAERMAYYTNLKPGDYRFQVRASNHQGTWSASHAEWAFTLLPTFRQTASFYVVIALAGIGVAAAFTLWRLSWQRRVMLLEQRVALDRERKRIARDMHDDLGAQLSTLALALSGTSEQAARESADAQQRVRDVIRHLNSLIWQVEPGHESVEALTDFLGDFAQDFLGRAGLRLRLELPDAPASRGSLTPESRRHVVAVAKEALRNVVRHAGASTVTLRLAVAEARLTVEIADDGRGFDPSQAPQDRGLAHMRERLAEIGGSCVIRSAPGAGTSVRVTLGILGGDKAGKSG